MLRRDPLASAASVPNGAAPCHRHILRSTAADSVTVNTAFAALFDTLDVGPAMLSSARVLVVRVISGALVIVRQRDRRRGDGLSPVTVVVPEMMMVSSPSTTASSVGVSSSLPVSLVAFAGIVMLPERCVHRVVRGPCRPA